MNNNDYKFTCGNCKHEWKSSDYPESEDKSKDSQGWADAREGYNCPQCNSQNVSGQEIK